MFRVKYHLLVSLLSALFFTNTSLAQAESAIIGSSSFTIILPQKPISSPDEVRRLEWRLEQQLSAIKQQFSITSVRPQITVKITANLEEYRKLCRSVWPSGGSYLPEEDLICLPPLSQLYQLENFSSLLRHELTHATLHQQLNHCPLWVEEFLAMKGSQMMPACQSDLNYCPNRQQLLFPKNKQQAHESYCQAYFCGLHFISSQKITDVASICKTLTESDSRESLGHK